MTTPELVPYAFVTCMATGAPWSEQKAGTAFDAFLLSHFGSCVDGGPSQVQDLEFSCAHPSRSGSNSLLKGKDACNYAEARETPRVIISVRGLWRRDDGKDVVSSPLPGNSFTKFWLAVRAKEQIIIPDRIANDRSSVYRRHPETIAGVLPGELLSKIRNAILDCIVRAEQEVQRMHSHTAKRQRGNDRPGGS